MSVMNGFHKELLDKIVGVNGHIFVQAADAPMKDFDEMTARIRKVKGVAMALPMISEGAAISSPYHGQTGALVPRTRNAISALGSRQQYRMAGSSASTRLMRIIPQASSSGGAWRTGCRCASALISDASRAARPPLAVRPRIKGIRRHLPRWAWRDLTACSSTCAIRKTQAIFQCDSEVLMVRVLPRLVEKARQGAPEYREAASDRRHSHRTGGRPTRLFFNARSSATSYSHHPDAYRAGGALSIISA
ncbi:MAG: hypothetical protein H6870_19700 [Methylobacteriaceae bacterium]|nr:hypothetical protein [Methylobacteriaceae bacterium]